VELLIATPPCQGLSTLGKNKVQCQYEDDRRNYLVLEALDIIDECDFTYVLIENVPKFIVNNHNICHKGQLSVKYSVIGWDKVGNPELSRV
jgi:site-specific DNA-cytosine methylase